MAEFVTDGDPAPEIMVEVLCQDHVGTYTLPFLCLTTERGWINAKTLLPVETNVIGWRVAGLRAARPNRRWEPHRPISHRRA